MSTTTVNEQSEPQAIENPLHRLTDEQIEAIGNELDALHDEIYDDLGERDALYIRGIIDLHRRLALLGRVMLFASKYRPMWAAGTTTQSLAKILENMEIGHNVMHGQWDWMRDPQIHSSHWDWDTASTAEAWKHSHNYVHHTYTNIRGKDKDLGYEIMRIDPSQPWHPVYLLQPLYNALLMALFEWGVAFHDLDLEAILKGEKSKKQLAKELKGMWGKARLQITKDYIAWPLVSALAAGTAELALSRAGRSLNDVSFGRADKRTKVRRKLRGAIERRRGGNPESGIARALEVGRETFRSTAMANVTANLVRNVWTHAIIFCGHFPDQTYTFSQEETENESRGAWYVRQLIGAANIEGGPMFHVASGNLGFQVEHHLFPDMPSTRYAEIAPQVKELCERYELPYNSGPFFQQLGMVHRTIIRLAFPGGKARPKPGPYRREDDDAEPVPAPSNRPGMATAAANGGGNGSGPNQAPGG